MDASFLLELCLALGVVTEVARQEKLVLEQQQNSASNCMHIFLFWLSASGRPAIVSWKN